MNENKIIINGIFIILKKVFDKSDKTAIDELKSQISEYIVAELIKINEQIDKIDDKIDVELSNVINKFNLNFNIIGDFIVFNNKSHLDIDRSTFLSMLFKNESMFYIREDDNSKNELPILKLETNELSKISKTQKIIENRIKNIQLIRKGYK